jgi:hypothetical protein
MIARMMPRWSGARRKDIFDFELQSAKSSATLVIPAKAGTQPERTL